VIGSEIALPTLSEAAKWDRAQELPSALLRDLRGSGLLGADIPPVYGGLGASATELGELCARVGGLCSSLRGLVTVQGMVSAGVLRWGTREQRDRWLPSLASGELIAGFAATEREAGSDLAAVRTEVAEQGDGFVVSGEKLWVTFGELADVFLVLGTASGRPATVLVEADRPGVRREPVRGQLGMRAAHLAHVEFENVWVPKENLLAPIGFGLSYVAATVLDHGRFTVAWGCVGMAEACLHEAAAHAARRTQRGVALGAHQLVRSLLARSVTDTAASRELCLRAARVRTEGAPEALVETVLAKYRAAEAAAAVADRAVQIQGATGCAPDSLAARCYRDAKVMEIIEGSAQVCELHIADNLLRQHGFRRGTGDG